MPPLYFNPELVTIDDLPESAFIESATVANLQPLVDLILDDAFDYQRGDFPRIKLSEWSSEKGLHIGSMIAQELIELSPPQPMTQRIITRLNVLGLFPDFNFIRKNYGSLQSFNESIGAMSSPNAVSKNQKYDGLSRMELLNHITTTYAELVDVPVGLAVGPLSALKLQIMYENGLIPSDAYLLRRLGGVSKINELLGFPNVKRWDYESYIQYGATVLRLNGPESLTVSNAQRLALEKYGPHPAAIKSRFGSWGRFKNLALEQLRNDKSQIENHQVSVNEYYANHVPGPGTIVPFTEMAQHRALWLLIGHYDMSQDIEVPQRLRAETAADIIHQICAASKKDLSLADIEITALGLNIFDDLWPSSVVNKREPIIANLKPRKRPIR